MPDHEQSGLVATDLPITLYLNQRLTFDLLATLEGGFSSFATVTTTSAGETTTEASGEAQLGFNNGFALLGVKLGGRGSRQAQQSQSESATEDIVHTPTSLFARLRKELHARELVRSISSSSELEAVSPSDFVEFEGTLRRSPIVELLLVYSELLPLVELADAGTAKKANRNPRKNRRAASSGGGQQRNEQSSGQEQIEMLQSAVTAEGSHDLVAEVGTMRVVLTAEEKYFLDKSMNDTVDGTFRVFGKVTRVIPSGDEAIGLLRKTALGKFPSIVEELGTAVAGVQTSGFSGPVETEIEGPTLQVIPIAIFS